MKIVTAAQMREIDQECVRRGTPVTALMETAGKAVAEETRRFLGNIKDQQIICLIGAGNNGGDGLVAARYLAKWGAKVTIYLCGSRPAGDANLKYIEEHGINGVDVKADVNIFKAGSRPIDSLNLKFVKERGIVCIDVKTDKKFYKLSSLLSSTNCVIDGLLGTGKIRPLEGIFKAVLDKVNAARATRKIKIVAIDLPSGMDADTGAIDPACPAADLTVTLAFPKPGLFKFPGAEMAGKLIIADIGIPTSLAESSNMELLTADWAAATLPKRPQNSNKGTFGKALVSAGSINYIGAAYLACSGALRAGAGLVTLATGGSLQPIIASKAAEITYLPLPESEPGVISPKAAGIVQGESTKYNALLAGCGLGQNPATAKYVTSFLVTKDLPPLVLDADGLNILAKIPGWEKKIPLDTVLTPHPGEMARLTGFSIEEIQKDRTGTALTWAKKWRRTVVLKGAFTVIAAPDGRCRISPYANPGLATAGTGDVLAGVITGLAAQRLDLFDAACLGVYLHGEAGEKVRAEMGETGMLASDLLPVLPKVIKELKARL
jgi:ADP-dependent NAD(P)H-hydrate dehydratase / NAD(P)H-hydrate epimerase